MASDDDAVEPGTSPMAVLAMLGGMRPLGLDVEGIAAAAGLSVAALGQRTAPLPIGELAPLWRAALRQFGRGTLGLHVGAAAPAESLLEYLGRGSPTLRAALGQLARYIGLASRNVRWVVGERGADGLTNFEEQATYAPDTIPISLREFGLSLTSTRIYAWFERRPREIWFQHEAQGPAAEYEQVLGCPARFGRPCMALRFDDEALQAPSGRHDPGLYQLLEAHAARVLSEMPVSASLRERVRRAVVERLRDGEPNIAAVAEALATSERSLQRKLQAEGVSFRDVVDEARHKLAVVYLGDPALSMTDVACLLGYSENAAFTRAFKRWTGQPPSAARR